VAGLLVAASLGAAGCGEKDEPAVTKPATTSGSASEGGNGSGSQSTGQSGNQSQQAADGRADIERAVTTVVGGGDPEEVCHELTTEKYVKISYGNDQGCLAANRSAKAADVQVSNIQVEGDGATAHAKPLSGPAKGNRIRVRLVREGKAWLVASTRSFAPVGP